jgi:Rad3-related DNA helicase
MDLLMADDIRKKFTAQKIHRVSQVIFGERQHLAEVLRSLRAAKLPRARREREVRTLERLIAERTRELNGITPGWDRKFKKAHDPRASSRELLRLAAALSSEDYLLARVLTEHAEAPLELLERMASHPYSAVRENVARHPKTPEPVLRELAESKNEPLWFLVACNPSTPADLRDRLRARMQEAAARAPGIRTR